MRIMEETHPCQLIATFPDKATAQEAANEITRECDLSPGQIWVFPPRHPEKSKPKAFGLGLGYGLLGGFLLALVVIVAGDDRALAQPVLTSVILAAVCGLAGLTFTQLIWWRPRVFSHLSGGMVSLNTRDFLLHIEMRDIAQQYAVRAAFKAYPGIPVRITDSGYRFDGKHSPL
jgi:hypothetical protein